MVHINWVLPVAIPIAFISIYFVWVILIIWYLNQFLKYKSITYIAKRYPIVTLTEIIFIISAIANFSVIILYRSISVTDPLYEYLWNFSIFSQPITCYGVFYSILWRCWHFYYDSSLNTQLESSWKTIIDPSSDEAIYNWHLNNKLLCGSPHFVSKLMFLMYFISCTLSISIWLLEHVIGYSITLSIDFFIFLIPYALIMISYRHTPKYNDELHVKTEMRLIVIFILISFISYLLMILIGVALNRAYHVYLTYFMNFTAAFYFFLIAMTHTKWVVDHIQIWMNNTLNSMTTSQMEMLPTRLKTFAVHKAKNTPARNRVATVSLCDENQSPQSAQSSHTPQSAHTFDDNNPINKQNVIQVFQNENTFNAFVAHLNAEYCLECILSFIEILQFEKYLIENKSKLNVSKSEQQVEMDATFNEQLIGIEFKEYIPLSQIVAKDKERECDIIIAKQKAYDLYNKYIVVGSEYEINISYRLRTRFSKIMNDYDEWINGDDSQVAIVDGNKLLSLFDMVSTEIYQLLMFSFSRFKSILYKKQKIKPY